MNLEIDDPIAALASPPGGAERGIVRISGPGVKDILADWFVPDDSKAWLAAKTARSHTGTIRLDADSSPVDCPVQILFWPNRRSYTGQPLIELHLPGSPCLLEAVLGEAYRHGARAARPGEFTLRAFLAGKLDLLQAEAVLGVIDAQSHRELQTALGQLAGGISGQLSELRRNLLELLADLEAGLDFVDEDIEFVGRHDVVERLQTARDVIKGLVEQTQDRMLSRVRLKVVLAGLPNAGKSTLFNFLAGAQSALVSPERGTTRDFLTTTVNWDDLSFDLIDTAGWEDRSVGIGAAAQAQRVSQLEQSDLVIWCTSAATNEADQALDDELFQEVCRQSSSVLRVWTKLDLVPEGVRNTFESSSRASAVSESSSSLAISVITGEGITDLRRQLQDRLQSGQSGSGQWLGMTAARCRETVELVAASLEAALATAIHQKSGDELIAVDIRQSLDQLGVILGEIYTDDILDRIFSKFCIGK